MQSRYTSYSIYLLSVAAFVVITGFYWHHNVMEPAIFVSHHTNLDAYNYYLPSYSYTAQNLLDLHIPLWNPYQLCGESYIGVLQGAIFYPPVLLFAAIAPAKAYSIYLMLHMILGGFFVMLLCRHWKLSWLASWAAAFTFMFCSNTIAKLFGPAFLANSIYLPLMLLMVLKVFETGEIKWAVALSLVASLALFAGWIQALVYSFYMLGAFVAVVVIRSIIRKSADVFLIRRGLFLLIFSAGLFFLISAVQTLPVIELGIRSTRSFGKVSEDMLTVNNTAMYGVYRLFYDMLNSKGGLLPFYLYTGMIPLLLSVLAFWNRRLRFYVIFLYGTALCALILSMGPQTPFFRLWLHLPMNSMFRAPFRVLFLHAFAISLLCGIGLDSFLDIFGFLKARHGRTLRPAALALVAASVLLIATWPTTANGRTSLASVLSAASYWPNYLLALSACVFMLVLIPWLDRTTRYLLGLACIGLILADLFVANHNYFYLPEKNPRVYEWHEPVAEKIRSLTETDNSRVFIAADLLDFSYCMKLGQLEKLQLINDYENMNPTIYNRYCNYMFGKDGRKDMEFFWGWFNLDHRLVHPEFLDYMSAKYFWLSRDYIRAKSGRVAENYGWISRSCNLIYADEKNMVFLNPGAMPRAYIVGKSRVVPEEDRALELLVSDEFSPDEEVVLLSEPGRSSGAGSKPASRSSSVIINSIEPEKVTLTAYADGDGFLVLTDQYYPGWKAWLDGEPTEIYRANYLFRSIRVPAGQHEVVFRYCPASFRVGAVLSLTGVVLLAGLAVGASVRRFRTQNLKEGDPAELADLDCEGRSIL